MESKITLTEKVLVQNLQALDKRAFAILYDNYGPALLGLSKTWSIIPKMLKTFAGCFCKDLEIY